MSRGYEKEGLPCIHAVWADLLKCHPLLSRTDHCSTTYVCELSFCRGGCTWRFIENFLSDGLTRKKAEILLLNKSAHICVGVRRNGVKLIRCQLIFFACEWTLLCVNRKDNTQQLCMAVWWEIKWCHIKLVFEVCFGCNPVYHFHTACRSKYVTTWQETNMSFRLRLFV